MAEKIVSPGVFTSEIDASFLPAAVADIGAAIIGPTVKGPAGVPTVVESIGEFEAMFGTTFKSGSRKYQYLTSHAAREYLKNSDTLTVVRILAGNDVSHASASVSSGGTNIGASFASGTLTIGAGEYGNQEVTIGDVDFVFVSGSTTVFDNSSDELYVESGSSTAVDHATSNESNVDRFVSVFNTNQTLHGLPLVASKLGTAADAKIVLSGSSKGTQANLTAASSSAIFSFNGDSSKATEGATNTSEDGISFKLHTLADGADQNSFTAVEKTNNVLSSGSKDNLRFEVVSKNNKKGTFNLNIRRGDDTSKRKVLLESYNNLSLDPESPNYIAKVIGDSDLVVKTDSGTGGVYLQSSGSFPNRSKYVRVEVISRTPDYLDSNGVISNDILSQSLPTIGSGSFQGGNDGNVQHPRKFYEDIEETNSQGLNLSNSGAANGFDAYIEALNLLKNQDEYDINMVMMPGVIDSLHSGIVQKAIDVVEERSDAFLVVDPVPYASNVADATARADARDSNYTAMYWPWVQIPDNSLGKNVWVPPSTVMGGIIAFNDKVAHPWFAPAGLNRGGIDVAIQAERKLTQSDRDTLYESAINPIATFPGQGVVVFGQKTLQKKASALDRVNVRRLLIRVKKFIASSSRFLVFEQNTSATRRRFLNIVNPFLEQVQANSGLSAFRVVMDETNNTPDQIDRNILFGQIFVQPTRTAEFIVLDFTIQPTGATFPE